MTNDKLITELLDKLTENKQRHIHEIGDMSDDYEQFKKRYSFYKSRLKDELPDFTLEELVKIHKQFGRIRDALYGFKGFDLMLTILDIEENTEEFEGVLKRNRINSNN